MTDKIKALFYQCKFDCHKLNRLKAGITVMIFFLLMVGCRTHHIDQTFRNAEAEFLLYGANFETGPVHVQGHATCFYILFTIPLCRDQSLATIAWEQMRNEAQLDGKSAQLVNVFEDYSLRWNLFYIFYAEYYTVSASVIVYKSSFSENKSIP